MIAAFVNHIWQSSLFAAGAGLLVFLLRNNQASVRYWVWFAASMKFLIPFSILVALGKDLTPSIPSIIIPDSDVDLVQSAVRTFSLQSLSQPSVRSFDPSFLLFGAWLLGIGALLLMWGARWSRVNSLAAKANMLPIAAPVPIKVTGSSLGPGLFGIYRPVVLLPGGIASNLTPQELNSIIAHELCHWRRHDNLMALFHMAVEALFWFNPLVWWLGARLNLERERACDESVVKSCSDTAAYVDGILKVCHFYTQSPLPCAAGVSSAELKTRLETILAGRPARTMSATQMAILAGAVALAVTGPLLSGWVSSLDANAEEISIPSPDIYAARLTDQTRPRQAVAIDPHLFDRYVGDYYFGQGAIMVVDRTAARYFAHFIGQPRLEIYPESRTKFFARSITAQLSFDLNSSGKAIDVVLHQAGLERRANRISAHEASSLQAQVAQRIKNHIAGPGTQAALAAYLSELENGHFPAEMMTPVAALVGRPQFPWFEKKIKQFGPIKSIAFRTVDVLNEDVYDVHFAHGETRWQVGPLLAGRLNNIGWKQLFERSNANAPSPGTGVALQTLIQSLEQGRPDYGDIDPPGAVMQLRQRAPGVEAWLKTLGPLNSLTFISVDPKEGMDLYEARFAHGRSRWYISPLTDDGKIQRVYFPVETAYGGWAASGKQ